ncbi:uncharacterized protein BYT42DRAFT_586592 [Radiomyces spectabilis]|uniref:uncharacterized protein n=1 Tax=Radiomyces spectabilis TaxID=64574 RepID=UPI00221EF082|nr:uncharacterized protein BYT42DRAFT_586592 [Radiomyces spectabilis]KAI8367527.1 hypothetical protein BYT42DRAFT_586592 [Radiomyces spectabilis]
MELTFFFSFGILLFLSASLSVFGTKKKMNTISSTVSLHPQATLASDGSVSNTSHSSSRRLSQQISDIVSGGGTARHRNNSVSKNAQHLPPDQANNEIFLEFDAGQQLIVRPNRIVRGTVRLIASTTIHATQIRIKFRAEETAAVKVREGTLDTKMDRIDQSVVTYFEVDSKVWGNEASAFSLSSWNVLEPGEHTFQFAMKFPNVNFPPSVEDPAGFSIRYIWMAQLDGPGFRPGLRSKEYVMPYRPIICAPTPQPWDFSETFYKDKKTPIARVKANLPQQVFCPDEEFDLQLEIESLQKELVVTGVSYALKKYYEGKILLQKGTARKLHVRTVMNSSVAVLGNGGSIRMPVHFHIPTRLVSPAFASRHLRVYYDLVFFIQLANHSSLLKNTYMGEVSIPIAIANLPNDQLLRVPDLTSVQHYTDSKEAPIFFDPSLDEPPQQNSIPSELWGPLTAALATPPTTSPPNYFSLPSLPPQFGRKERVEKVSFTSRLVKAGFAPELGDPVTVMDYKDGDWW